MTTPRRRWCQFRLRTLLLIVAVFCVPLAWVGVRMSQKRNERAVIAEIERRGGDVYYDWQIERSQGMTFLMPNPKAEPTGPKWLRLVLGDDFFSHVDIVSLPNRFGINDDVVQLVAMFSEPVELDLTNAEIGDTALVHLTGLTNLRSLFLTCSNITDAGLLHLKSLTTLKHLGLYGTKTTKAGVDDLAKALPECVIKGP